MQTQSFLTIQLLEDYVLSPNKNQFLEQLPKSSLQTQFLEILDKINASQCLENLSIDNSNLPEQTKISLKIKNCLKTLSSDHSRIDLIDELNQLILKYSFSEQQTQPISNVGNKSIFGVKQEHPQIIQVQHSFSSLDELFQIFYDSQTVENLKLIKDRYLRKIDCSKINWTNHILVHFLQRNFYLNESDSFYTMLKENIQSRDSLLIQLVSELCQFLKRIPLELQIGLVQNTFLIENNQILNQIYSQKFPKPLNRSMNLDIFQSLCQERTNFLQKLRSSPSLHLFDIQYLLLIKKFDMNIIDEDLFMKVLNLGAQVNKEDKQKNDSYLKILFFYLRKFPESNIDIYQSFFHSKDLQYLQLKAKMYQNIDVDISSLSPEDINKIISEKILRIHKPQEGQLQKELKIKVDIKAVKKLEVNIYQINSKILNEIEEVDLKGIEIAYQKSDFHYSFQFDNPPNELHEEDFLIDKIPAEKMGIFLICFQGDYELESRCILRKGGFKVVQDSISGHLCQIFDDKEQLVEDAQLEIDGQIYSSEGGVVRIPKKIIGQNKQAYIIYDSQYFPLTLSLFGNDFYLNFQCIYNEESFQKNNKVKMNIFTVLQLNGELISVQNLTKLSLQITNQENGMVMDSQKFSVESDEFQDFAIYYQVPENPNCIKIELKGEIDDQKESLLAQKIINFKEMNLIESFYCFSFMMDDEENYFMKSVGCNGEDFPLSDLTVEYQYPFSDFIVTKNFNTNDCGVLNLGKLENCHSIKVKHDKYEKVLILDKQMKRYFEYLEEETVKIPDFTNNVALRLFHEDNIKEIQDEHLSKCCKKYQEVKGLQQGINQFQYEDGSFTNVLINTMQQEKLNEEYFKYFKTKCLKADQHIEYEIQENDREIIVDVKNEENTVLYLIKRNTIMESEDDLLSTFKKRQRFQLNKRTMMTSIEVINNKKMNEELNYIAQRQQKGSFINQEIPMPRNILLREAVKNVTIKPDQNVLKEEFSLKEKNIVAQTKVINPTDFYIKAQSERALTLQNFLHCEQSSNAEKLEIKNFKVVIEKSRLEDHSFCYLILCSGRQYNVTRLFQKQKKMKLKDQRYHNLSNISQIFKINREVNIVDEANISNAKVVQEQYLIKGKKDLFSQIKKIIPNFKYDFLEDWNQEPVENKIKLLNEKFSLPFCLFIYFTDNSFHKEYVKPFIQNKFKKNLIEAFLADDHEELISHCSLSGISQQGTIENILLYLFCCKNEINFQENLYEYLQNQKNVLKDEKMCKKYFDFFISQNKIENHQPIQPLQNYFSQSINQDQTQQHQELISSVGNQCTAPLFFGSCQGQGQINNVGLFQTQIIQPTSMQQNVNLQNVSNNNQSSNFFGNSNPQQQPNCSSGIQQFQGSFFGSQQVDQQGLQVTQEQTINQQSHIVNLARSMLPQQQSNSQQNLGLFGQTSQQQVPQNNQSLFGQIQKQEVSNTESQPKQGLFSIFSAPQNNISSQQQVQTPQIQQQSSIFGRNPFTSTNNNNPQPIQQAQQNQLQNKSSIFNSNSNNSSNQNNLNGYLNQNKGGMFGRQNQKVNLQSTVMYKEKELQVYSDQKVNDFFIDFINHVKINKNWQYFNSSNFIQPLISQNQDEILMMLAMMSFQSKDQENTDPDDKQTQKEGKVIQLRKQVLLQEVEIKEDSNIVVRQNIQKSFFSNLRNQIAIKMKITILNLSEIIKKGKLLFEIPEGSIPLGSTKCKTIQKIQLESFKPVVFEIMFYFPEKGNFKVSPSKFVVHQKIVAESDQEVLVIESNRILNQDTFNGSSFFDPDINEIKNKLFDGQCNPESLCLNVMKKLLKDKEIYDQIISIQKKKGRFVESIWKYSILHKDFDSFKELLNYKKNIFKPFLTFCMNELISFDFYESVEFYPLIKQRVFSTQNQDYLNPDIKNSYFEFLNYLILKTAQSSFDKFHLIQFMLYFGKIEEAKEIYKSINEEEKIKNQLQSDYLSSYFEVMEPGNNNTETLKRIEKYVNYPFKEWRKLFKNLAQVLNGRKNSKKSVKKDENEKTLDGSIEEGKIVINSKNVEKIFVKYYEIDTETHFSLNPFKEIDSHKLRLTKPVQIEEIKDPKNEFTHEIEEFFVEKDLIIALEADGLTKTLLRNYCDFITKIDDEKGSIYITNKESEPISEAYVKIFYMTKEKEVLFLKDGFTNYEGHLNYSKNIENVENVEKLSILITARKLGSDKLQANPWKKALK